MTKDSKGRQGVKIAGNPFEDIAGNNHLFSKLTEIAVEKNQVETYWIAPGGKIIYANEAACRQSGYSREELEKKNIADLDIHWNEFVRNEKHLKEQLSENKFSPETEYRRKDNSTYPVVIKAQLFQHKGVEIVYINAEKINKKKEDESGLMEGEKNMRFLSTAAMELIELYSLDEVYLFLAEKIYELVDGNAIITVSEFDEDMVEWQIKELKGLNRHFEKVTSILGFDLRNMKGKIKHDLVSNKQPGKLYLLNDSISSLSGGKISDAIFPSVAKLINLKDIYTISMKYKHGFYGNVTILRNRNCKELNNILIEAFISQVTFFVEKMIAKKELVESQNQLSNLIGNLQGVVYRCRNDENWTMEYLNDEIFNLSGYHASQLVGNNELSFEDLIYPEDRDMVRESVEAALNYGERYTLEYRIITRQGKVKWVWEKGLGIRDEEGNYTFLEGFITDLTEIKENEKRIRDQLEKISEINLDLSAAKEKAEESDRLKSAFLENMSHEIRTPMNAILGFSEILVNNQELPDEKRNRFLQNISNSGEQLLRLINDIIDISKIESNQLRLEYSSCNIDECILEILENVQNPDFRTRKKNLEFRFNPSVELNNPEFLIDTTRFRQILYNLLSNAVKYTDKGKIEIGYDLVERDSQKFIEFYVSDTGIGIPAENLEMIFERFAQAENPKLIEGTGLGLSITRALVELLGGRIQVDSVLHRGSKFYVQLPFRVAEKSAQPGAEKGRLKEGKFPGKIIYIAEDDPSSFLLLMEYLEDTEAEIHHAENGFILLELINQRKPDLILLDINMPVLNGYMAIREIRNKYPGLPVIAQTAYAMENERERILEAGCDEYLSKPVKKSDLISLIGKFI